jgi:hypothetical protein
LAKDKITHQTVFTQEPGLGLVAAVPFDWAHKPVRFEFEGEAFTTNAIENNGRAEVRFSSLSAGGPVEIELYENK